MAEKLPSHIVESKLGKNLLKKVNKVVKREDLIQDGDKILIAVSGGKDSLSLLTLLKLYEAKSKAKYQLFAVNVKTDYHQKGREKLTEDLRQIFEIHDVPYTFEEIIITKGKNGDYRKPDCFWCARNRRKEIFFVAQRLGCNKIAYGHNLDDIAQTILMNQFYHGNIKPMYPRQVFFDGLFTLIRPMAIIPEKEIAEFAKECNWGVKDLFCDVADYSKREKMRNIIDSFGKDKEMIMYNILKSAGIAKK